MSWCDFLLLLIVVCQLLASPFTKVEESFNVQAIHDLLYTNKLEEFDHLAFPGVVPRTFIGPIIIATIAQPMKLIYQAFGWHKETMIIGVRLILGLMFLASFSYLRSAFAKRFRDEKLYQIAALLSCCQFHLLFYSTRPLANTFAAILANLALACWLNSSLPWRGASKSPSDEFLAQHRRASGWMVVWMAANCILFRCDMIILALPLIGCSIAYGWMRWHELLKYGFITSLIVIVASVSVDSFYWRRFVWPEFEVLYFNTLAPNASGELFARSSAWGTHPWWWYFMVAVPKSLLGATFFLPIACLKRLHAPITREWNGIIPWARSNLRVDVEVVKMFLPIVIFLFLYSFLAHKELRFIYPTLPFLTCLASLGFRRIQIAVEDINRDTPNGAASSPSPVPFSLRLVNRLIRLSLFLSRLGLLISVLLVLLSSFISSWNYPGGHAMAQFHSTMNTTGDRSSTESGNAMRPLVHISNLAATTGVTRFGEDGEWFRYSKEEGITLEQYESHSPQFDYLISEHEHVNGFEPLTVMPPSGNMGGSSSTVGRPAAPIISFARIHFDRRQFPFIHAQFEPMIYLLQRLRTASTTTSTPST